MSYQSGLFLLGKMEFLLEKHRIVRLQFRPTVENSFAVMVADFLEENRYARVPGGISETNSYFIERSELQRSIAINGWTQVFTVIGILYYFQLPLAGNVGETRLNFT